MFVGSVSSLPSGTRYRWAWVRLGTVAGYAKHRPFGGLGTMYTLFGAMIETTAGLGLWIQPQIGNKPGVESCLVSQVVADTLARLPL